MVKKVDRQGFEEALRTPGKPVVVDFAAEDCVYCKKLAPILAEVAEEHAGEIEVFYVDTDEQEELAERYDIMTVPSVFVFVNGEVARSAVNPRGKKALLDLIFAD